MKSPNSCQFAWIRRHIPPLEFVPIVFAPLCNGFPAQRSYPTIGQAMHDLRLPGDNFSPKSLQRLNELFDSVAGRANQPAQGASFQWAIAMNWHRKQKPVTVSFQNVVTSFGSHMDESEMRECPDGFFAGDTRQFSHSQSLALS